MGSPIPLMEANHFEVTAALKGSTKLLDPTHVTNKSYPIIPHLYSDGRENAATSNSKDDKVHPQGRRPALGRKRAQFSLNPISSHSLPTIDVNSSVDHIEDPEKYFLAYEQHENADKELKKLRGDVATDVAQNQRSRTARERRPGILRKTTSYRDRFSVNADAIDAFRVPEEASPDRRICSQSVAESSIYSHSEANEKPSTSHATGTNSEHFDVTEGEGFVANKESDGHDLLDNLLSQFKDSDEGDVEALLFNSLQIKSINSGKMHVTELGSTQRFDGRPLDSECTIKLDASQFPRGSLIHTRSPLSLQRRITLKNPLEDPYSLPPTDDEPTSKDFYISTDQDKQSFSPSEDIDYHNNVSGVHGDGSSTPPAMNGKSSSVKDKIGSLVPGADKIIHKNIPSEEEHAKSCSHETNAAHSSSGFKNHRHDASTERDVCLEEKGNDKQLDDLSSIQPQLEVKDLAAGYANQNNTENLASSSSRNAGLDAGSFGLHAVVHRKVNAMAEGELVSPPEISKDKSSPSRTQVLLDGHSKNSSILPEENDETQRAEEAFGGSRNRGKIKRASIKRQRKETSTSKREKTRGRSLAGFGSKLESGVRRSTRYRHRPLEYWRGERFLYGRILDSLATVIGVKKYASPAKGAKDPMLKVESLVDEEYADLVAKSGSY